MTCNDKELFKEAMDDVKPLKEPARVVFLRHKPAAAHPWPDEDVAENFLITALHEVIPLDYPLSYKRDGIQQGVLDKLGAGHYAIEASLNLTRSPVETCRRELFDFILRMRRQGARTLLIIHGKGRNNHSHANIVRSFVSRWLAQFDQVQAFCCAQAYHGGTGACYVALKKSDIARGENRERFARRGR